MKLRTSTLKNLLFSIFFIVNVFSSLTGVIFAIKVSSFLDHCCFNISFSKVIIFDFLLVLLLCVIGFCGFLKYLNFIFAFLHAYICSFAIVFVYSESKTNTFYLLFSLFFLCIASVLQCISAVNSAFLCDRSLKKYFVFIVFPATVSFLLTLCFAFLILR